jgi:AcrR family transcriptional regulator
LLSKVAPRSYKLGRRAASAATTRQRIVDAAAEVYRERGIAGASIAAIAERADVSRGSVLHHFGDGDGLLAAVLDHVVETVEYPDERVLTVGASKEQRIHEYVAAMARFYERSTSWWEVFSRDMDRPDLQARERDFWVIAARLQAAALGDVANDRIVAATLGTLTHAWTFGTLRSSGLSLDEAIEVVADLVLDTIRRREAGT